ncbi:hypothetical protein FVE85_8597 [Porphyridium purpureum]|uniref:Uncharacterized protein n=1 Tax=Porphyridium purpureum TaxID=35688 RepID=A0A5J4YQT7_PORPP|nr:hypothetical protein FVE85_8597 [Porphyridium purpureum]|eukprot:POR0411..scf296_7
MFARPGMMEVECMNDAELRASVRGIAEFFAHGSGCDVGPAPMQLVLDGTGLPIRRLGMAPPPGVHPRVFFGPEDVDALRKRLQGTVVGRDALSFMEGVLFLLSHTIKDYNDKEKCRWSWRVTHQQNPRKNRLGNVGYYANGFNQYHALLHGKFDELQEIEGHNYTSWTIFTAKLAILAFKLLLFPNEKLAHELAEVLDAYARWNGCRPKPRRFAGGLHLAMAYDFHYNSMSPAQRDRFRTFLAQNMDWCIACLDIGVATTSNWITLCQQTPIQLMAIEGELDEARDGVSNQRAALFFKRCMLANYNFLTYGWYPSGQPFEGQGKNEQNNVMYVAFARRGYNFFAHPHAQAYATCYLNATMWPDSSRAIHWDSLGGMMKQNPLFDVLGTRFGYPTDLRAAFPYRAYMERDQAPGSGMIGCTNEIANLNAKFDNGLLNLLMLACDFLDVDDAKGAGKASARDPDGSEGGSAPERGALASRDWSRLSRASRPELDFFCPYGGLLISRSDHSPDAIHFTMHTRQDIGGHTHSDRNGISLIALRRAFIQNVPQFGFLTSTVWASGISKVDGRGLDLGRAPSKVVWQQGSWMSGDATYAYNFEWAFRNGDGLPPDTPMKPEPKKPRWIPVPETTNDFKHPAGRIPYAYGDLPYFQSAHWRHAPKISSFQKRARAIQFDQMYRHAGVVRGALHSYVLCVDDIALRDKQRDIAVEWGVILAKDLELLQHVPPKNGYNAATDLVLAEPEVSAIVKKNGAHHVAASGPHPSGARRMLLIRCLDPGGLAAFSRVAFEPLEPGGTIPARQGRPDNRLVLERVATPRASFRIMMYPHLDTDPVPELKCSGDDAMELVWPDQSDRVTFSPYTKVRKDGAQVQITGVVVSRDGVASPLVDTRETFEPADVF